MKLSKLFLLTLCSFSLVSLSAQQKLALQSKGATTIFSGTSAFVNAYNQAIDGDTIYLSGGSFGSNNYVEIKKRLTIIGAGHHPDSTLATRKTVLNTSLLSFMSGSENSYLEGVEITGGLSFGYGTGDRVEDITVVRCKINGSVDGKGATPISGNRITFIQSTILGGLSLDRISNAGIFNSIIQGRVGNSHQNVFKNNLFLESYHSYQTIAGDNNQVENNFFYRQNGTILSGHGNHASNNITVNATPFWGYSPISSGNYVADWEDLFIRTDNNSFNYDYDYHLQSPESYPGTDGTQVGIYGGIYPYKEGGVPSNPHISSQEIAPTTDNEGRLRIKISVSAQEW